MELKDLTPMVKIEIVIPARHAPEVTDLIRSLGARGYTAVSGVAGFGHHGERGGRMLFNDHDALTMLITVVPEDRADAITSAMHPVLTRMSGVMFVSETAVSRAEYFV